MNTIPSPSPGRRRRRVHTDEFKADAVTACQQPGVSLAAIALSRGINANLLRRWAREAEAPRSAAIAPSIPSTPGFLPLQLPAPASEGAVIHIELQRGGTTVMVKWPTTAAADCAAWLSELLR